MEAGEEFLDWAAAGDTVTLTVTGTDMIHFGSVIGDEANIDDNLNDF